MFQIIILQSIKFSIFSKLNSLILLFHIYSRQETNMFSPKTTISAVYQEFFQINILVILNHAYMNKLNQEFPKKFVSRNKKNISQNEIKNILQRQNRASLFFVRKKSRLKDAYLMKTLSSQRQEVTNIICFICARIFCYQSAEH